jgi:hypothetical protein
MSSLIIKIIIKISEFMPILGLRVDAFRAACSYNIDSQPLGLKSVRKETEI